MSILLDKISRKEVKKMKRCCKMLAMMMAIVTMLLCMVMPAHAAAVEPDVTPLWTNTNQITITLSFPDYGYADASIVGKVGVTKIVMDTYVYRQSGSSWIYVNEAHQTFTNSMAGGLSCKFTPIKGAYYRAEYTFTVTRNGVDEVITKTQYRTCE